LNRRARAHTSTRAARVTRCRGPAACCCGDLQRAQARYTAQRGHGSEPRVGALGCVYFRQRIFTAARTMQARPARRQSTPHARCSAPRRQSAPAWRTRRGGLGGGAPGAHEARRRRRRRHAGGRAYCCFVLCWSLFLLLLLGEVVAPPLRKDGPHRRQRALLRWEAVHARARTCQGDGATPVRAVRRAMRSARGGCKADTHARAPTPGRATRASQAARRAPGWCRRSTTLEPTQGKAGRATATPGVGDAGAP
jgi:hypothetical protein